MRLHAALCALLALASAPARAQEAPAEDASSAPVEEIQILGERPGPQLWKITNGEHTLWLLGLLQPLPKRMQWKSGAVEQVLDESQEVIASGAAVGARIGPIKLYRLYRQWRGLRVNPNEQTLADVLPPPIFAAGALFQAAVDRVGLTTENDVHDRVEKLAKKRDLPIRQVKLMLENPSDTLGALGDIPLAQEIACLETTIARLETDVDAMRVRATAWADGDIDAFKAAAYPDQQQACWNAIGSAGEIKPLIEQAQRDWLAFFDAALASSKVSLAMQSMDRVLAPDGVLAHARSQGYEVRGPE